MLPGWGYGYYRDAVIVILMLALLYYGAKYDSMHPCHTSMWQRTMPEGCPQ